MIITGISNNASFENRSGRRDKTRLSRWITRVHKSDVSRGCRAWLMLLASRSNNTAKPVWGGQVKQAREIHCSERQVRTYRREAEEAGLIITHRGKVERLPNGKFHRQQTNKYQFCIGALDKSPGQYRAAAGHRPNLKSNRNHINKYSYPQANQVLARLPGPSQQCERCDGGWIVLPETDEVIKCLH